jgi:hypothetical protein
MGGQVAHKSYRVLSSERPQLRELTDFILHDVEAEGRLFSEKVIAEVVAQILAESTKVVLRIPVYDMVEQAEAMRIVELEDSIVSQVRRIISAGEGASEWLE